MLTPHFSHHKPQTLLFLHSWIKWVWPLNLAKIWSFNHLFLKCKMDQFHPSTSYWWIQSSNLIFRLATNSFKWRKMRTSWFKAFLWCNSGRVLTVWLRKWGSIVRSNRSLKSKWIFQPERLWLNILRTSESIIRLNSAKTSCKQVSVNSTTTVLMLTAWTRLITVKNLTKITRLKCANNGTSKPRVNVLTKTNVNLYTMMTNQHRGKAFH